MCVFVHVCMCVCVRVCMHRACMYVCVYAGVRVCVCHALHAEARGQLQALDLTFHFETGYLPVLLEYYSHQLTKF